MIASLKMVIMFTERSSKGCTPMLKVSEIRLVAIKSYTWSHCWSKTNIAMRSSPTRRMLSKRLPNMALRLYCLQSSIRGAYFLNWLPWSRLPRSMRSWRYLLLFSRISLIYPCSSAEILSHFSWSIDNSFRKSSLRVKFLPSISVLLISASYFDLQQTK